MKILLFVCTANIARSPMAAALCNDLMLQKGLGDNFRAESAGTWGTDGLPPAQEGVTVMAEYGLDISQHHSRVVTFEVLLDADLILTMEAGQAEALRFEFPQKSDRIFQLTEMVGQSHNIEDPYNQGLSHFRVTAQEISQILENGIDRILALAAGDA